jgi:ribosomal protein S18 acetylase RimI-like enzyme
MTLATVTAATREERQRAIATLTLAFGTDPLIRWFYPDSDRYLRHFPEMIEYFGGRAFEHDTAYRTDDFTGAALWLPPGVGPDEERMGQLIQESTDERIHESIFSILGQMEEHHPQEPVWYLPVIGVDPVHQGRGIGSALLDERITACDRDGMAAFLESSNPRNIPLYERHGFEVVAEVQAGDSPPIWPMLRKAR